MIDFEYTNTNLPFLYVNIVLWTWIWTWIWITGNKSVFYLCNLIYFNQKYAYMHLVMYCIFSKKISNFIYKKLQRPSSLNYFKNHSGCFQLQWEKLLRSHWFKQQQKRLPLPIIPTSVVMLQPTRVNQYEKKLNNIMIQLWNRFYPGYNCQKYF